MTTYTTRYGTATRWLFGALSTTLVLGCHPDQAVEPAAIEADAAQIGSVTANATSLSNRFAYALADNPTSAGYAPTLSSNASGGGIRITHSGPGAGYAVTFGGFGRAAGETETFIVTPYGPTRAHCVAGFYTISGSSITVNVFCIDPVQGTGIDSRFTILAVGSNSLPARSGFTYANNPFAPSYTPDPNFSYSSAGSAITIFHDSLPGNYRVNFGTGNPAGSSYFVNSRLTPSQCQIGAWLPATARVRCFDSFGGFAEDADYQVLQVGAGRPGQRIGYAFANRSTVASYVPNTSFSHNSSGKGIRATRSRAVGRYAVTFIGLQRPAGQTETVQVTPFASVYTNCAVLSWTSLASALKANVECHDITGNFRDSSSRSW